MTISEWITEKKKLCEGEEEMQEKHLHFAKQIFESTYMGANLSEEERERLSQQIPSLGIVPFRAAWNEARTDWPLTLEALAVAVNYLDIISTWPLDSERVAEPKIAKEALEKIQQILEQE